MLHIIIIIIIIIIVNKEVQKQQQIDVKLSMLAPLRHIGE